MNRTLFLLALAVVVCLVAGVVAFVLKLAVALMLIGVGAVGVAGLGIWVLAVRLRGRSPPG